MIFLNKNGGYDMVGRASRQKTMICASFRCSCFKARFRKAASKELTALGFVVSSPYILISGSDEAEDE